jgi:hypothetical protein
MGLEHCNPTVIISRLFGDSAPSRLNSKESLEVLIISVESVLVE